VSENQQYEDATVEEGEFDGVEGAYDMQ